MGELGDSGISPHSISYANQKSQEDIKLQQPWPAESASTYGLAQFQDLKL